MAMQGLFGFDEVAALIGAGRALLLAGDESLLSRLPAGRWVGGTTALFMTAQGGVADRTRLFVTDVTDDITSVEIRSLSADELPQIGGYYPDNGFAFLILPGFSDIHGTYAREVQDYEGVFDLPLVGWVSGVAVEDIGKVQPKVFAGSGAGATDRAALFIATLPDHCEAYVDIVNVFRQGGGDTVEFAEEGFSVTDGCRINGREANLAAYIADHNIDTRLPLVADYNGVMVNASIRAADAETGKVDFYAPVFRNTAYRFAEPVDDYIARFNQVFARDYEENVVFSCNCVLNYLYAALDGKKTGCITGPVTFGEIAYILMNQTIVYLSIESVAGEGESL